MKFFVECFLAFPSNFSVYACWFQFHTGFLVFNRRILSRFRLWSWLKGISSLPSLAPSSMQQSKCGLTKQTLKCLNVGFFEKTPDELDQYQTVACIDLSFCLFAFASDGLYPGPNTLKIVPEKLPLIFPIQLEVFSVKSYLDLLRTIVEVVLLEISLAEMIGGLEESAKFIQKIGLSVPKNSEVSLLIANPRDWVGSYSVQIFEPIYSISNYYPVGNIFLFFSLLESLTRLISWVIAFSASLVSLIKFQFSFGNRLLVEAPSEKLDSSNSSELLFFPFPRINTNFSPIEAPFCLSPEASLQKSSTVMFSRFFRLESSPQILLEDQLISSALRVYRLLLDCCICSNFEQQWISIFLLSSRKLAYESPIFKALSLLYLRFDAMMGKLGYLLFGAGAGVGGYKIYSKYNPESNITLSSKGLIDSYVADNNLAHGHMVTVLKALGVMFKSFYNYGMDSKLQGFNYNSTYLIQDEIKDNYNINHIYCVFSPNQYLCGHPQIQHGGATATIIDNTLGYLAILNTKENIATVNLNLTYKRPVKKDQFYVFEGKIDRREGRKVFMSGKVKELETGQVKVQTQALFMTVNWENQMSRIVKQFFKFEEGLFFNRTATEAPATEIPQSK